jgi:PAS domain S-box-containing protein
MAAPLDVRPAGPEQPRILLVDDRPENLLALRAVLSPLDVALVGAGSGEDALKALLDDDYAVVLLDVQMPGMDGFETAGYIRARPRSSHTPIIFLTAVSTDVSQMLRGYEAGAVDYVLKPFDADVLRAKVAVFAELDRHRRARERSDELLSRAWESAPTGVVLVDADGLALRVNPAFAELTGRPLAVGESLEERFHPEDRAALAELRARLLSTRAAGALELRLRCGEEDVPVAATVSAVRETGREPRSLLVQVEDLRERHRAQEAQAQAVAERAARAEAEAVAATLQRDLLPRELPDLPALRLDAHFHAGGDGTDVGGDWYDAIALPAGRLGLVVGDVAGRGVIAAARMGQLRSVARAYALEGHAPGVVAQRLNIYHRALNPDDLTTLVYAVIEPDLGQLRFINAGHPPPLLIAPGERPRLLAGVAPPLGVSDLPVHEEIVVPFEPGAALVLYTDGLVERRGEGIDAGLARLTAAAARARGGLEDLRERVVAGCMDASPGDDDVTALFVRAEEAIGPRARFTLSPDGEALGALRRMLRRWLAEADASADDVAAVTMAANEAWENAIEHAHAFAPVPITTTWTLEGQEAVICVEDAGALTPGVSDPDRGRGIALMQLLMDETSFSLGGRFGGTVTLRRRLRVPADERALLQAAAL